MNILRIAEALHFARPFYFKSLDSSADPSRTKILGLRLELAQNFGHELFHMPGRRSSVLLQIAGEFLNGPPVDPRATLIRAYRDSRIGKGISSGRPSREK
jgi:hypothetical protein